MKAHEYLASVNSVKEWERACKKVYAQLQRQMAGKSTEEIDVAWKRIKDTATAMKLQEYDERFGNDDFKLEGVDTFKVSEAVYKKQEQERLKTANHKRNVHVVSMVITVITGCIALLLIWNNPAWIIVFMILGFYAHAWTNIKGPEFGVLPRVFTRSLLGILSVIFIWFIMGVSGIIPYEKHHCESFDNRKERSQCYNKIWNDAELEAEKEILRLKLNGE